MKTTLKHTKGKESIGGYQGTHEGKQSGGKEDVKKLGEEEMRRTKTTLTRAVDMVFRKARKHALKRRFLLQIKYLINEW